MGDQANIIQAKFNPMFDAQGESCQVLHFSVNTVFYRLFKIIMLILNKCEKIFKICLGERRHRCRFIFGWT